MGPGSNSEISPEAMRRMERVKKLTKMMEKMASGVLSGVVKVSGFFTSGQEIFQPPPWRDCVFISPFSYAPTKQSLSSYQSKLTLGRVCDAVEVAGRNVMSTTSVVTTGIVSQSDLCGKPYLELCPIYQNAIQDSKFLSSMQNRDKLGKQQKLSPMFRMDLVLAKI
ncbi:hypothetical protein SO802_017140 [Lithocarpus litseifolius]|uniref:Senescence domain-containing protein n=1 Tax=Lithocarpus litseifolius TaxID=425828 RepID=A0AAW2CZ64_9ROSI